MGLFDTLTCDFPLPIPELQGACFQTKSLDPGLTHYHIDAQGRLFHVQTIYESIPEEEQERRPSSPALGLFAPVMRPVGKETRPMAGYSGDIEFHPPRSAVLYGRRIRGFRASFRRGRMVRLDTMTDAP